MEQHGGGPGDPPIYRDAKICEPEPDTEPEAEGVPWCYGNPDEVCPTGSEGFIEPQEHCAGCKNVRECLQLALQAQGKLRLVQSKESSGVSGFLKRWSDKKLSESHKPKK